jgi:hypothetical protein
MPSSPHIRLIHMTLLGFGGCEELKRGLGGSPHYAGVVSIVCSQSQFRVFFCVFL